MSWLAWVGLITGSLALLTTLAFTRGPVYYAPPRDSEPARSSPFDLPHLDGHKIVVKKNGCGDVMFIGYVVDWTVPDSQAVCNTVRSVL